VVGPEVQQGIVPAVELESVPRQARHTRGRLLCAWSARRIILSPDSALEGTPRHTVGTGATCWLSGR
jgi:hypothetical protein